MQLNQNRFHSMNGFFAVLCPHLDDCMREVVSAEEDVEIGRCVSNHLHIECTHAWEVPHSVYKA